MGFFLKVGFNRAGLFSAIARRVVRDQAAKHSNNNYGIFNKINTMEMNIFSFFNFLPQSLPI
jgi:hypothetical protein